MYYKKTILELYQETTLEFQAFGFELGADSGIVEPCSPM